MSREESMGRTDSGHHAIVSNPGGTRVDYNVPPGHIGDKPVDSSGPQDME